MCPLHLKFSADRTILDDRVLHHLHVVVIDFDGAREPIPADRSGGAARRHKHALLPFVAWAGVADSRAIVLVLRVVSAVEQAFLEFEINVKMLHPTVGLVSKDI